MKKRFVMFLLFFWVLHFLMPMLYYATVGFFNIYSSVNDARSLNKAFLMNSFSIFIAIILLALAPDKKNKIEPAFQSINLLFYACCLYTIILFFALGGYNGILSGALLGSLFGYINQFINLTCLFALLLFYQRKKHNFYFPVIIFVVVTTIAGSRSAVITVFLITVIFFPMFKNFDVSRIKIKKTIVFLSIISPILFYLATSIRSGDVDLSVLPRMIVGRISMLELSMIPIDCKDNGGICNLDVFYEKYNIVRQFLQAIDSMYPGDIWITDVQPNQYYRSAFLGHSVDYSAENYMSMNMTLPSFFYMYTNASISCLLSACLIVAYYLLLVRFYDNIYLFCPLLLNLYNFIYGFDFVITFSQIYSGVITTATVFIFVYLTRKLKKLRID